LIFNIKSKEHEQATADLDVYIDTLEERVAIKDQMSKQLLLSFVSKKVIIIKVNGIVLKTIVVERN
jgi:hypothetical protein